MTASQGNPIAALNREGAKLRGNWESISALRQSYPWMKGSTRCAVCCQWLILTAHDARAAWKDCNRIAASGMSDCANLA